jgi:hypothetical protein
MSIMFDFNDAMAEELIEVSPCVVRKGVLPKKVDEDPDWRTTAIYDRSEIEKLISDTKVLEDGACSTGLTPWPDYATARRRAYAGATSTSSSSRPRGSTSARRRRGSRAASPSIRRFTRR